MLLTMLTIHQKIELSQWNFSLFLNRTLISGWNILYLHILGLKPLRNTGESPKRLVPIFKGVIKFSFSDIFNKKTNKTTNIEFFINGKN